MTRKTLDERIEEAQKIGHQRWNRMVLREADRLRREIAKSNTQAAKRRARMHVVRDGGAR